MNMNLMEMNITRREILRFVGGSALGFFLTPIPWKALDDSAIWTQNWPWIPEPGRGDISYKMTSCSLCPAACGIRARCVGNQPVSLNGIASHPLNQGALCPMGVVAHHLRYHPARISRTLRITGKNGSSQHTALTLDEALKEVADAMKDASAHAQTVAVIDGRPGRTASLLFQQLTANTPRGVYIAAGDASLEILASMFEKPVGTLGFDIDHANTVLSFGVPLFDGWGTPARTARYLDRKSGTKQHVIQVEPFRSRTAELADNWIPLRPGTEAVFALGLAYVILQEKLHRTNAKDLHEFGNLIAEFTPETAAELCGISQDSIKEVARIFAAQAPSIAIAESAGSPKEVQSAVMVLNLLAGNIGQTGGVAVKRPLPSIVTAIKKSGSLSTDFSSIPDHSVGVMLIDESLSGCQVPDALLLKKLIPEKGIIVSLSPFVTERPFCMQYVFPALVFLESMTEVMNAVDVPVSTLSLSAPLVPAPIGLLDPIEFVQRIAQSVGILNIESGTTEELLKKRIAAIHKEARGGVFTTATDQTSELKDFSSPDDLWNALIAGGCWLDAPNAVQSMPAVNLTASFSAATINTWRSRTTDQMVLVPVFERSVYGSISVSPIISKVGQESGLRPYGCLALLNPRTGSAVGVIDNERISIQTKNGLLQVQARFDASIMRGVVALTATEPDDQRSVLALCDMNAEASIMPTPVKIQKV
jgi:anaerobic selenocysteine-containing dehydrogenase